MWENVNEFPTIKRRKYPQYTSECGCVVMRKSNMPFIPENDYSEFHFIIFVLWNEWPVGFVHNHTAVFRSILNVLSPFNFWKFINEIINAPGFIFRSDFFPDVFQHTALFSC